MSTITVRLDRKLEQQLNRLARKTGRPKSDLVREALRRQLAIARVFQDTNVLVAAFATRGLCADVLHTVLTEHELLTSPQVLTELERVMASKLGLPRPRAGDVVRFVREEAEIIEPSKPDNMPKSDPDDGWILAAALEGKADVLVSGDRELLDLAADVQVRVVSPRGFWELLRAKDLF
jgi:putative PIN family toxin of toxin-antitoxin system